jgi:hypothetical protein
LLARATAACFGGVRASNCGSHGEADLLPGLAKRMTDIAPNTNKVRNLSLPGNNLGRIHDIIKGGGVDQEFSSAGAPAEGHSAQAFEAPWVDVVALRRAITAPFEGQAPDCGPDLGCVTRRELA